MRTSFIIKAHRQSTKAKGGVACSHVWMQQASFPLLYLYLPTFSPQAATQSAGYQ